MQRRVPGKLVAVRAVIWCLFSMVWIYLSLGRVASLRAAGRPIGFGNWAILGFWLLVLGFWAVIGIRSWSVNRRRRDLEPIER